MTNRIRSAKGEMVDFDLIKIKSQMTTPSSALVQEREKIIDKKLKRKIKKVDAPIPKVKKPVVEELPQQEDEKPKKPKHRHIGNIKDDKPDDFEAD